jgi:O-antigen/teichoic acid export membrane protein
VSTLSGFFKDTVIYGLASVLPRLINFALIPVLTAVLDTRQFSEQTTWYVYAAFINVILTLGLETAFFRFYSTEEDKNKVVASSFIMVLLSSTIFLLMGLIFSSSLTSFLAIGEPILFKILLGVTFLDTIVVIPFALLRVTGRPLRFFAIKIANILFQFVFTAFLLLYIPYLASTKSGFLTVLGFTEDFKPDIIHLFIANLAASLFTFFCLMPEIFKIRWIWDAELSKKLLHYGLPIMIGGFAYIINENIDKLMIPRMIDENTNGIYAACYKLGVFMTLYITAFRMGAEPFFFNQAKKDDAKEKYSKIMTWFVLFGTIFMVFVIGFIDFIASIFIKQSVYLEGLYIVPIILLANLFSGIYMNLSIWYKLTDRTRYGMYLSIFGAILTIISLIGLIPFFGIWGAALSTLFTYFTMAFISWFLGHKVYPVPYDYVKIGTFICVSIILSFVSFQFFRKQFFINCGIVLLFLVFVFLIMKNEIFQILRSIRSKTNH